MELLPVAVPRAPCAPRGSALQEVQSPASSASSAVNLRFIRARRAELEDAPQLPRHVHVERPPAVAQPARDVEAEHVEHGEQAEADARVRAPAAPRADD